MTFRLSSSALLETRRVLIGETERNAGNLYSLQTQLGAYLVLGNGVAIFVLAQAAISGQVQPDHWFSATYLRFVWGLGVAFAAMAITYFFGLFGLGILHALSRTLLTISDTRNSTSTNGEAAQAEGDAQVEFADVQKTSAWLPWGMAAIVLVYIASGSLFIWGLAGALHLRVVA